VAIPKRLIQQAGLSARDVFFDVEYRHGYFILKPLEFQEKIPPEALKRFKEHALQVEHGDRIVASMGEAIAALDRTKKRR
jgi:hypothetical protein